MFLTKKKKNNVFLRELALFSRERGRIKENVLKKKTHSGWGERDIEMTFPGSPENRAWDKNLGQEFIWRNKECYSRLYMK